MTLEIQKLDLISIFIKVLDNIFSSSVIKYTLFIFVCLCEIQTINRELLTSYIATPRDEVGNKSNTMGATSRA